jgi:hypothetical protein
MVGNLQRSHDKTASPDYMQLEAMSFRLANLIVEFWFCYRILNYLYSISRSDNVEAKVHVKLAPMSKSGK